MNSSQTTISQSSKLGCLARLAQGARKEYELCLGRRNNTAHSSFFFSQTCPSSAHPCLSALHILLTVGSLSVTKHLPGSLLLHFLYHCSPCLLETSAALETQLESVLGTLAEHSSFSQKTRQVEVLFPSRVKITENEQKSVWFSSYSSPRANA